MYRGLSDYLGRTSFFHSTQVTPGVVRSNSTPFGNFIAPPPRTGNTSGLGSMRSGSQSSVQVIGSVTVASSNDEGEEKVYNVGDENV
jgi:hypothetical protein